MLYGRPIGARDIDWVAFDDSGDAVSAGVVNGTSHGCSAAAACRT